MTWDVLVLGRFDRIPTHTHTHFPTLLLYSFAHASSLTHACIISHPDIYVTSYINMQHNILLVLKLYKSMQGLHT